MSTPDQPPTIRSLVAYGDCNTIGEGPLVGHAYPEIVGRALGCTVENLGYTMSTTRELLEFTREHPISDYDLGIIQYGLVDSWLTFRHAPYVLYYPDNPRRRVLRKLVKKLKKIGRTLNFKSLLGSTHVVPLDEYRRNIERAIEHAPGTTIILLSTAPNLDEPRNPHIRTFNEELARLAARHPNTIYLDIHTLIDGRRDDVFHKDGTHINALGHQLVADEIVRVLRAQQSRIH